VNAGQARTRLAREAVLDAAAALFLERGYAATTMDAVSESSRVPPATVYRLFSSKLGLLRTLLDQALALEGAPMESGGHSHAEVVLGEADPRRTLARFAAAARSVLSGGAAMYQILASAAPSDPQAAALLARYGQTRERSQGLVTAALARRGALRPGLTEREAADVVHAIVSPEVYRLLVISRGWTPGHFERWLVTTLTSQLLPEGEPQ
jgi:AcrR family transcriptional regulator